MTDRTNQHFVPQFYFRHFSGDGRKIGTLLTRDGRTIPHASIKGQCARRNFYGSKELEALFAEMEGRHSAAIRAVLGVANHASSPELTDEELFHFFQAVMFQRGRTALEIEKSAAATGELMLEMFKHYLKHESEIENVDEMLRHIDAGEFTVTEKPCATVARALTVALDSTLGITDLHLLLIRNRTDYPFIFSDAPVVFYNSYCRNVRHRGVLGVQSPGLQVFYPLDAWTLALLFDGEKYDGPFRGYLQFDAHQRADISQLNAIQLHHSLNAVYFGNPHHEQYVSDLWHSHRRTIRQIRDKCVVGANFWMDGKPPEGEIIQVFEPQIDFSLNLSFIHCTPVSEANYAYAPRSPELRNELRQRQNDRQMWK